jgi:hypothetical protein
MPTWRAQPSISPSWILALSTTSQLPNTCSIESSPSPQIQHGRGGPPSILGLSTTVMRAWTLRLSKGRALKVSRTCVFHLAAVTRWETCLALAVTCAALTLSGAHFAALQSLTCSEVLFFCMSRASR